MRLLVTNDDGIGSLFLHELIFALKAAGHELYVIAPVTEQSWTGASKTRHRPVKSAAVDRAEARPPATDQRNRPDRDLQVRQNHGGRDRF